MNYNLILNKRLLCFLSLNILASIIVIAQPFTLRKDSMEGREKNLNITPYGFVKSWYKISDPLGKTISYKDFNSSTSADTSDIGVFWWNARDIQKIEVIYENKAIKERSSFPIVQYWQHTWPEKPPRMPNTEDLEDDPWQGKWITAATDVNSAETSLTFTFKPLSAQENANAVYLPGDISYRRTLKVRLLYPDATQKIKEINVFSASKAKNSSIRIELGCNEDDNFIYEGKIEIFNGRLKNITPWHWDSDDKKIDINSWKLNFNGKPKGIITDIISAIPTLPGSNDETVVTLRSSKGTFSFSINDLEKGPIYIPYFNTYITDSYDSVTFSDSKPIKGKTIREQIITQPEQSYDRARKEIPHLDPLKDQNGNRMYLPLASDANWQKFAVQWGGNIFMSKRQTKAQGKELKRCNWNGDMLTWGIGTGANPVFDRDEENCQMSILNDYLPVINSRWRQDGLNYDEEVFTTLLRGPLSPYDPSRDEQTAAILMVKLTVSNSSLLDQTSDVWLSGNQALNNLSLDGSFLMDQIQGEKYLRCYTHSSNNSTPLLEENIHNQKSIHYQISLKANSSEILYFYFPFVGDLISADQKQVAALDYDTERTRVVNYWRDIVAKLILYNVPERKFNEMAKAVVPHIRMSVTKDPKSNFYMVPAASLGYGVYANEAIFQTMLLDRMGDFNTVSTYLNTFLELQGSRKLPGAFSGDQNDVFYGVRVDSIYDLTFNGYNMHHGTTLWGLANHYLHSDDNQWLLKAAPNMIRAANWIIEQRNNTKIIDEDGDKVIEYGLLPAGLLEDAADWRYWYATNAYAYLGIETMTKAFEKAGLPQAEFFRAEADSYHKDIRKSLEKAVELSPVIRLRNNIYIPYVPVRPYQRFRYFGTKKSDYYKRYNNDIHPNMRLSATREALYGPIVLVKTGIIDANEAMANWILNDWEDNLTLSTSLNLNAHGWVDDHYWFSRGGMVFQANLQNPVDTYLKRHETKAALRGLYNSFISCLYPDVNVQTEEYRMWEHGSGPFYKIPDEARVISQVCDLLVMENGNELWLANGVPRRWLEEGERVELINAHTEWGKISYSLRSGKLPETIEADIQLPRDTCSKITLFVHAPYSKPMRAVTINGKEWLEFDANEESIVIPQIDKKAHISILY